MFGKHLRRLPCPLLTLLPPYPSFSSSPTDSSCQKSEEPLQYLIIAFFISKSIAAMTTARVPSDLVDTCTAVADLIDALADLPTSPPSLYVDVEGVNLSRHGSISILQLLVSPHNRTYLIDVHTLGDKAFSTAGGTGQTLKGILESDSIPKVFFDVRCDSNVLFTHFGINLAGIHDIQLMELATRFSSKKFVYGLSKCIDRDLSLNASEKQTWEGVKDKGRNLFAPERGGSYEVFNARPLSNDMLLYCIQDVQFMPKLWQHYDSRMTPQWAEKVQKATKERVDLSQTAAFNGDGKHMARGPLGWG
jgi:exonuclease 3'-5' domain-containing protein 1